jgi:hypothetical protein
MWASWADPLSSTGLSTHYRPRETTVNKFALRTAIQHEIRQNDFSPFIDEPPSVAQGGKGVVARGCPACRKRINTVTHFLDHLAEDAMPAILDRLESKLG